MTKIMNVASGSYEYEGFLGSKLNNLRSFELQSKILHSYKKCILINFESYLKNQSCLNEWLDLKYALFPHQETLVD